VEVNVYIIFVEDSIKDTEGSRGGVSTVTNSIYSNDSVFNKGRMRRRIGDVNFSIVKDSNAAPHIRTGIEVRTYDVKDGIRSNDDRYIGSDFNFTILNRYSA
jgi:hypothetical protein